MGKQRALERHMNNDLISRKELIARLVKERNATVTEFPYGVGFHNGLSMAHAMAINSPAVDAEMIVYAEWIPIKPEKNDLTTRLRCSNCGFVVKEVGYQGCPNCRAKMS